MAGQITCDLSPWTDELERLGGGCINAATQAVYSGAGVMVKAYAGAVNDIATAPFSYAAGGSSRQASPEEKEALSGCPNLFGISKHTKEGLKVQASVGVNNSAGYFNGGPWANKGKGVPLPMLMRSIEHGTSFRKAQPVLRRAANRAQTSVNSAMAKGADEALDRLANNS